MTMYDSQPVWYRPPVPADDYQMQCEMLGALWTGGVASVTPAAPAVVRHVAELLGADRTGRSTHSPLIGRACPCGRMTIHDCAGECGYMDEAREERDWAFRV